MSHPEGVVAALVRLADNLTDDFDVTDTLDALTHNCTTLLGADGAGILLADPNGSLRAVSATEPSSEAFTLAQLQAQEGPCIEAFRARRDVSVPDVAHCAPRWPAFAKVALRWGFAAVHALPMSSHGEAIGALGLFNRQPVRLPPGDLSAARAMTDVATIAILQRRSLECANRVAEQLQSALSSRVVIEQSKGLLAERAGISIEEAFRRLRDSARSRRIPLVGVAGEVLNGTFGEAGRARQADG